MSISGRRSPVWLGPSGTIVSIIDADSTELLPINGAFLDSDEYDFTNLKIEHKKYARNSRKGRAHLSGAI